MNIILISICIANILIHIYKKGDIKFPSIVTSHFYKITNENFKYIIIFYQLFTPILLTYLYITDYDLALSIIFAATFVVDYLLHKYGMKKGFLKFERNSFPRLR